MGRGGTIEGGGSGGPQRLVERRTKMGALRSDGDRGRALERFDANCRLAAIPTC